MSNLTDLLPAGAGGKQVDFVASGTLSSGQTVILKTDGTVEAAQEITINDGATTPAVFVSNSPVQISAAVTSSIIVVAYCDSSNSNYGTSIVGTISGSSITFGTAQVFSSTNQTSVPSVVLHEATGHFLIAYRGANNWGYAVGASVSGTTLTFGTPVMYSANRTAIQNDALYEPVAEKVVVAYWDQGNGNWGSYVVITLASNLTATSSGINTFATRDVSGPIKLAYDSGNGFVVVVYREVDPFTFYGYARAGALSGSSISWGTEKNWFTTGQLSGLSVLYDPDLAKLVFVVQYFSGGQQLQSYVSTVASNKTITTGSGVSITSGQAPSITYDSNAQKVVLAYRDGSNNRPEVRIGTVSSTSNTITWGGETVLSTNTAFDNPVAVFNSTEIKTAVLFNSTNTDGRYSLWTTGYTSTNSAEFIGITAEAISDTASGSVTIKGGISTNVTGLTPNATYYVQADGSLSTTASDVLAGKALSSTSINLDYTT